MQGFIIILATGQAYHWFHALEFYQHEIEISGGSFIMKSFFWGVRKEGGGKHEKDQIKKYLGIMGRREQSLQNEDCLYKL